MHSGIDSSVSNIKNEFIELYISRCEMASKKANRVLYLLLLSSIILFSFLLNSAEYSWANYRIDTYQKALSYKIWNDSRRLSVGIIEFDKVKKYMDGSHTTDSALIASKLKRTTNIIDQNIANIKVDFLSVSYDINDLSIISGICFLVLFIWYNNLLKIENHIIKITKNRFLDSEIPDLTSQKISEIINVQHLRTIKNQIRRNDKNQISKFRKGILRIKDFKIIKELSLSLIMLCIPLTVYLIIAVYDFCSYANGFCLSENRTIINICISSIILVSLISLLIRSKKLLNQINQNISYVKERPIRN